ncbi:MAG: hypothetical protein FWF96_05105, partial [Kiritimatiellaeota bacterium]|nr:hypothetical protein [Kiritimatiellota bacterium]
MDEVKTVPTKTSVFMMCGLVYSTVFLALHFAFATCMLEKQLPQYATLIMYLVFVFLPGGCVGVLMRW